MSEAKLEQAALPIKVLIMGDKGVGKSAMIQQFLTGTFSARPQIVLPVRNASLFKEKTKKVKDKEVQFSISDSVLLKDLTNASVIADIDVIFLTYDLTNPNSLTQLQNYVDRITALKFTGKIVLFGNKCDLKDNKAVTAEQVDTFKAQNNIWLFGTGSASTGETISDAFSFAAEAVMNPEEIYQADQPPVAPPLPQRPAPTLPIDAAKTPEPKQEQKIESPRPKKSCATIFWKFMAHPVIAALGFVVLLAGVAALLATTFGVGGVALAGVLTIAGSAATGVGGVSTLLSAIGFCRNRCASKGGNPVPEAPAILDANNLVL